MSEPFDRDLQSRLERLALATPLTSPAPLEPVVAHRPRNRGLATLTGMGVVIVVALVVVAAGGLFRGLPGGPAQSGSPSPTAAPAAVPVEAATDDGTFRLSIRADAEHYAPDAPISVSATLTYLGPLSSIDVSGSSMVVGFGVDEVGGTRHVEPVFPADCVQLTYTRNQDVTYPFVKSGAVSDTDPNAAFLRQYLNITGNAADPVLRLPAGQWRIFASTDLIEAGCTQPDHQLTSSVTVVVGDGAPAPTAPGSPSGTAVASPTFPPPDAVLPYPDGCAAYQLSPRRCAYIVEWAKQQAGFTAADEPLTAELLGDPDCEQSDQPNCVLRTTAFIVRVRLVSTDGHYSDETVFCGIEGQYSLLCSDPPQINIVTPAQAGYYDVPCRTENGGCASALPSPDPAALLGAQALRVSTLDIPIDHAGAYVIPVGQAVLPNGLLSGASVRLADDHPTNLLLSSAIQLAITDHADGTPLVSAVDHGVRPGTETVDVALTFTVESFDPGAVLHVIDLAVY